MDHLQRIFYASMLWRTLSSFGDWCSSQWRQSAVVQYFLNPTQLGQSASESSFFCRLFRLLWSAMAKCYSLLHLDIIFRGSIFLNTILWCSLVCLFAPILPTMAALGLCVVAYGSLCLNLLRDRNHKLHYSPMNKYLLIFAGLYLAAVLMSVSPADSLLTGLVTICFCLTPLIITNIFITRTQLESLTAVFVLSATLVALIGIGQYLFGVTGSESWVDPDMFSSITIRIVSTLQNPNMLAQYLVLVFPLSWALLFTSRNKESRILWSSCSFLILIALILTFSRGGWVGGLIALGVFLLLLRPKLLTLLPIILLVLFFILPDSVIQRFTSIGNMDDTSTSYRVAIWMGSIAMLKDYWLCGVGPGTEVFNRVYPIYSYNFADAQHSHNLFLQLIIDGGIATMLIFIAIIVSFSRHVCSAISKNTLLTTRIFPIASLAGVAGFLAQGMTDYSFYNHRVALVFWLVLGLGCAWASFAKQEVAST